MIGLQPVATQPSPKGRTLDVMLAIQDRAIEAADIADYHERLGGDGPYWRAKADSLFKQVRRLAGQLYPENLLT